MIQMHWCKNNLNMHLPLLPVTFSATLGGDIFFPLAGISWGSTLCCQCVGSEHSKYYFQTGQKNNPASSLRYRPFRCVKSDVAVTLINSASSMEQKARNLQIQLF